MNLRDYEQLLEDDLDTTQLMGGKQKLSKKVKFDDAPSKSNRVKKPAPRKVAPMQVNF